MKRKKILEPSKFLIINTITKKNSKKKEIKQMKKLGLFLLVVAFLVGGLIGSANAFQFKNIPLYQGPVKIKYTNWEIINFPVQPAPGLNATNLADGNEDNWGIAKVTSIFTDNDPLNPVLLWSDGDFGEEITGTFYNIDIDRIVDISTGFIGTKFDLDSTNLNPFLPQPPYVPITGMMDLWLNPAGSLNNVGPAARIGVSGYNTISNVVGGQKFLELQFSPGKDLLRPWITIDGTFELASLPGQGSTFSYLDVRSNVGFAEYFDNQHILGTWDFDLGNSFDIVTGGLWNGISEDPIDGFYTPEPATMLLLGAGLLGLAGLGRKRFMKKA
jgi:hypothetical protein